MPMTDPESGDWIVYNGEIYNFLELRQELAKLGEKFQSGTDTEVILKAYKRWGHDCVHRFRGMFAFAIWDHQNQELFLARDRLGKKPLYYFIDPVGRIFIFASEVRALLASGQVERRLEPAALQAFLFNGFVVSPLTMVKGVMSLLPGYWMRVGRQGEIIEIERYWKIPTYTSAMQPDSADLGGIRQSLMEAVQTRLISDVPLGAFLSGGLDSSTIVALMAREASEVHTFSITFDESSYDESPYSNWVAQCFGTKHTEIRLRKDDFYEWLPDGLAAMDQPTFDGLNSYCVARAAKESGMTVALSGMGADEVFGGYPFFKHIPWIYRLSCLIPRNSAAVLQDHLGRWLGSQKNRVAGFWKILELLCAQKSPRSVMNTLTAYQTANLLFPYWTRKNLLVNSLSEQLSHSWFGLDRDFQEFIKNELSDDDQMSLVSKVTLRLFLGERCFRDMDSMSMGVSLEVRAPFTDHLFLENVWRVPGKIRCKGAPDKPFEWEVVRPFLGEAFPQRNKQGFTFPFEEWLRDGAVFKLARNLLSNKRLAADIGLKAEVIQKIMGGFFGVNSAVPWSRIWSLFVLLHWCEHNRVFL